MNPLSLVTKFHFRLVQSSTMSRHEEGSRTRSYDEVTRYQVTSDGEPISRTRSRSRDDRNQNTSSRTTETLVRTRSRSQTQSPYYYSDCIPCSSVRPASTLRKRLIVCCDGTFCAADKGKENNPTNIARLSRAIANVGIDEQGAPIIQIVNYQSGVGTGKLTTLNRATQGGMPTFDYNTRTSCTDIGIARCFWLWT